MIIKTVFSKASASTHKRWIGTKIALPSFIIRKMNKTYETIVFRYCISTTQESAAESECPGDLQRDAVFGWVLICTLKE